MPRLWKGLGTLGCMFRARGSMSWDAALAAEHWMG